MITVGFPDAGNFDGATPAELRSVTEFDPIRQAEILSIRRFVVSYRDLLEGRVLDFGAGKPGTCREPQPYRDLVSPDAEYVPIDKDDWLPPGPFDAILCTQVLQCIPSPGAAIDELACRLAPNGYLILTYPTSWDEVEDAELFRFTKAGMKFLLEEAGLTILAHERRAEVKIGNFCFPLGYGVVARK